MRKIDITGQKFGKLTAIAPCQDKKGYWTFKCDCGRYVEMRKNSVMSGHALSCGCSRKKKHSDKTWEDFISAVSKLYTLCVAKRFISDFQFFSWAA